MEEGLALLVPAAVDPAHRRRHLEVVDALAVRVHLAVVPQGDVVFEAAEVKLGLLGTGLQRR